MCNILGRDSFFAPEAEIFTAVNEWCKHNSNVDVEAVVSFVRLPLMNLEQLLKVVRPSGILDPERLLDAIEEKTTSKYLPYRGALCNKYMDNRTFGPIIINSLILGPEENVATAKFCSKCIQGEVNSALLDGNTTNYDMEMGKCKPIVINPMINTNVTILGYTRHSITDFDDTGIIVELGMMSIINHIKILLWDRDLRSYSYYVEVSVNQTQWDRVIDHTDYYCRSWQHLYFPARVVRYIKLVGTHNTSNKVFHVVALEAMHTYNMPKLVNGIIAPVHNVALVTMSATVIEGVSRTKNALLNGDYINYDWDSGYTCHQLGSGVILIQLGTYFNGLLLF